jgi:hypothetical protein
MSNVPLPTCKAVLLCSRATVKDQQLSLHNILDEFVISELPGNTPEFTVFVQLGYGVGRYHINVEIRDPLRNLVIGESSQTTIDFQHRLERFNLIIPIPPVPIRYAGVYEVWVLGNEQDIDQQEFTVQVADHE